MYNVRIPHRQTRDSLIVRRRCWLKSSRFEQSISPPCFRRTQHVSPLLQRSGTEDVLQGAVEHFRMP